MAVIRYCRGLSIFDNEPELREARDFDEFERKVLADTAREKGKQYVCSPLRLNGGPKLHRCAQDVEPRRFLALDFDHVPGPEVYANLRLWLARFHGFGYTTASHTPDKPRFRAFLELDRAADRMEGMRLGAAVARDIADEFGPEIDLDHSVHRGEQPCFGPVTHSQSFKLDGDPIAVDIWLADAPDIDGPRPGAAAISPEDDPVIIRLKERAMYLRELAGGKHAIICPWEGEHSEVDARTSSATVYIQPHHGGYVSAGFKCQHAHCKARGGSDLLKSIGLDWQVVRDAYKPGGKIDNGATITSEDEPTWPGLDLDRLAHTEPQAPKFIIPDWLPVGYATLFAGHGGVGKSALALHLAVCIAAGIPFFGLPVERRRVLYLSCEDREPILHWRLFRICAYLGVNLSSLRGWLEIDDLVGANTILWTHVPMVGFARAAAFQTLAATVKKHVSQVLMLDGITDTYAGNENNRAEIKQYVNSLVSIMPAADGAVIMIGHLDKLSAKSKTTTEGYSGSTGWHNAARARWFLYPETTAGSDADEPENTGSLMLELQKSNFGRIDQSIKFSWSEESRLFVGQSNIPTTHFERTIRDRAERKGVLLAVKSCIENIPPILIPVARQGPHTAFHVLSIRPDFPDSLKAGRMAKMRFWRLIEQYTQVHDIEMCVLRSKGARPLQHFLLTSTGLHNCQYEYA